jgi:hypothetical protein
MKRQLDLTGQRFGKLVAIKEISRSRQGVRWLCQCDCDKTALPTRSDLLSGRIKSCGCYKWYTKFSGDEASLRCLYTSYKSDAKRYQRVFELSLEQFRVITSSKCFYCAAAPSRPYKRPYSNTSTKDCDPYLCNGVDRVDSNFGYVFANCVACCTTCNYMKLDLPQGIFISHIQKIAKNFGEK